jgi:predicted nucleic acid-binding protein
VWTWARDRRFPLLASWFNAQVAAGHVLVCDIVILELIRLSPNEARAKQVAQRLDAFKSVPMPTTLWQRARELQLLLSATGDHRRVPPVDLLIGSAAETAGVPLVHYDRDYERLANVCALEHHWLLPDGTLA